MSTLFTTKNNKNSYRTFYFFNIRLNQDTVNSKKFNLEAEFKYRIFLQKLPLTFI